MNAVGYNQPKLEKIGLMAGYGGFLQSSVSFTQIDEILTDLGKTR